MAAYMRSLRDTGWPYSCVLVANKNPGIPGPWDLRIPEFCDPDWPKTDFSIANMQTMISVARMRKLKRASAGGDMFARL